MDEIRSQQIKEVREPIKTTPGQAERYDLSSERNGVSNLFIFFEPLKGWRHVEVTDHRTAIDWAYQVRDLVDRYYPKASLITDVMDNLNTHCGARNIKRLNLQRHVEFLNV